MPNCSRCGFETQEDAQFCIKCGKKLKVKCAECQAENPEDALFCSKCGKKLKTSTKEEKIVQHKVINWKFIVLFEIILIALYFLFKNLIPPAFGKGILSLYIMPFIGGLLFFYYIKGKFGNILINLIVIFVLYALIYSLFGEISYSEGGHVISSFSTFSLFFSPNIYQILMMVWIPILIFGILGGLIGKTLLTLSEDKFIDMGKVNFLKKWKRSDIISFTALTISIIAASSSLYYTLTPGEFDFEKPSIFGIIRGPDDYPSDHVILPLELTNSGGHDLVIESPYLILKDTTMGSYLTFDMVGEYSDLSSGSFDKGVIYKRNLVLAPHTTTQKVLVFRNNESWDGSQTSYNFRFEPGKNYSMDFGYTIYNQLSYKQNITKSLIIIPDKINQLKLKNQGEYWYYWPI